MKRKKPIKENPYKEPKLELFNELKNEGDPMINHQPSTYMATKHLPKNPPPNFQEIMKKQAVEDAKKPPLFFLNESLRIMTDSWYNPTSEKRKEDVAYLLQKARYYELGPNPPRMRIEDVIKKVDNLQNDLKKREARTQLDIQELSLKFTESITNAWDKKPPLKKPPLHNNFV